MGGSLAVDTIRVRAVEGRTKDPFRGSLDESPRRLASRAADDQPFDVVAAAVEAMSLVEVKRTGRRFALERGDDALKVAFVSAAPRVSLDDLVLEGDGRLALAVLHALLPLFGPVEIRVGRFEDLIDGHEPLASVVERFDAWFVEDSLRVAKRLQEKEAVATAAKAFGAGVSGAVRAPRVSGMTLAAVALGLVALAVLGPLAWNRLTRKAVGEACTKRDDCQSGQCLPHEPMKRMSFEVGGRTVDMPSLNRRPSDPNGVCTQRCARDTDCPTTMTCRGLASVGEFGSVTETMGCVPRAWHPDEPAAP